MLRTVWYNIYFLTTHGFCYLLVIMIETLSKTRENIPKIITDLSYHLAKDTLAMKRLTTYLDTEKRQSIQEVVRVHYHDKEQVLPMVLLKKQKKGEKATFHLSPYPIDFTTLVDCSPTIPNTIHLPSNFEEITELCNPLLSTTKPYLHNKSGNWYQVVTTILNDAKKEFVIYTCMDRSKFPDNHYIFAREIESFLELDVTGTPRFS
jgi:hypothetical protein